MDIYHDMLEMRACLLYNVLCDGVHASIWLKCIAMDAALSLLESLAEEYGVEEKAKIRPNPSEPAAKMAAARRLAARGNALLKAFPKMPATDCNTPPYDEDQDEDSSKRQKFGDAPWRRGSSSSSAQTGTFDAPIGARSCVGSRRVDVPRPHAAPPPVHKVRPSSSPAFEEHANKAGVVRPIGAPMPRSSEVPKSTGLIQSLLAESEVAQRPKLSSETPRLEAQRPRVVDPPSEAPYWTANVRPPPPPPVGPPPPPPLVPAPPPPVYVPRPPPPVVAKDGDRDRDKTKYAGKARAGKCPHWQYWKLQAQSQGIEAERAFLAKYQKPANPQEDEAFRKSYMEEHFNKKQESQ